MDKTAKQQKPDADNTASGLWVEVKEKSAVFAEWVFPLAGVDGLFFAVDLHLVAICVRLLRGFGLTAHTDFVLRNVYVHLAGDRVFVWVIGALDNVRHLLDLLVAHCAETLMRIRIICHDVSNLKRAKAVFVSLIFTHYTIARIAVFARANNSADK